MHLAHTTSRTRRNCVARAQARAQCSLEASGLRTSGSRVPALFGLRGGSAGAPKCHRDSFLLELELSAGTRLLRALGTQIIGKQPLWPLLHQSKLHAALPGVNGRIFPVTLSELKQARRSRYHGNSGAIRVNSFQGTPGCARMSSGASYTALLSVPCLSPAPSLVVTGSKEIAFHCSEQ